MPPRADSAGRPRIEGREGTKAFAGLVLVRKEAGLTSFQTLAPIKQAIGSAKVGHAGTLDRFAVGLLIALAGPYSRLAAYVQAGEKLYRGRIRFGAETATLDPEGEVVAEGPAPSLADLEAALPAFVGAIRQRPPAYSAVHVEGRRAYEIALGGREPELKERTVVVSSLELLSYENGEALVEVRCSSGTYIRSLARDIALSCGSRAHLAALERLAIGPYRLEDAVGARDFDPGRDLRAFTPDQAVALGLAAARLAEDRDLRLFRGGGRIPRGSFVAIGGRGRESAVFGPGDEFLGVAELGEAGPLYRLVLPRSEAPA